MNIVTTVLLFILVLASECIAFRRHGDAKPFTIFEKGFTTQVGKHDDDSKPVRINQGGLSRSSQAYVFTPGMEDQGVKLDVQYSTGESVTSQVFRFSNSTPNLQQICPAMVGPMPNGVHYCVDNKHGYCDRRSGTCRCFPGYQGIDCNSCAMNYYDANKKNSTAEAFPITPGRAGDLPSHITDCRPKLLCPDNCSGAGTCDYSTGKCSCEPGRMGDNCETAFCKLFGPFCESCEASRCTQCRSGFHVHPDGQSCVSCQEAFDPRCAECTHDRCTLCADLLLTSALRSGARALDSVPTDEFRRTFQREFSFGTQDPNFFATAEHFAVSESPGPQKECTLTAAGWVCTEVAPAPANFACGHHGTVSWTSPTFAVDEQSGQVWVSVERSGGGVGKVSAEYSLEMDTSESHAKAGHADVSPTTTFTTSQTLHFDEGVVKLSFPLTIHDDRVAEPDETFLLVLHSLKPEGLSSLGAQATARVTILDDDFWRSSAPHSKLDFSTHQTPSVSDEIHHDTVLEATAGEAVAFDLVTKTADGLDVNTDTEHFLVQIWEFDNPLPQWMLPRRGQMVPMLRAPFIIRRATQAGTGECQPSNAVGSSVNEYECSFTSFTSTPKDDSGRLMQPWELKLADSVSSHQTPARRQQQVSQAVSVQLAVKGGLIAWRWNTTVFTNLEPQGSWNGHVDRVIDFKLLREDNGHLPSPNPLDSISTRTGVGIAKSTLWQGGILPDDASMCNQPVAIMLRGNGGVRMWLDEKLAIDLWNHVHDSGTFRVHTVTQFDCNHVVPLSLHYRNTEGNTQLEMLWKFESAEDSAATVVPPESLHYFYHVDNSPYPLMVHHGALSHLYSECIGRGVVRSTAGRPTRFKIIPRDAWRNLVTHSELDAFEVSAVHDTVGSISISGSLSYSRDRSHIIVDYSGTRAGQYSLGVTVDGNHVAGSPFALSMSPGSLVVSECEFMWQDHGPSGTAGVSTTAVITSRDEYGNIRSDLTDKIGFIAVHNTLEYSHTGSVTSQNDGTYLGSVVPEKAGVYLVYVVDLGQCATLSGSDASNAPHKCAQLADSPYTLTVQHAETTGSTSFAAGEGVESATSGVAASFTVTLRDTWKNLVSDPSDNTVGETVSGIEMVLDHVNGGGQQTWLASDGACTHQGGASFLCTYIPTKSTLVAVDGSSPVFDQASLHVSVQLSPSGQLQEISESPFEILISDGSCSGTQSVATGPGVDGTQTLIVGESTWFEIQARDAAGNDITDLDASGCVFDAVVDSSALLTQAHQKGSAVVSMDSHEDLGLGRLRVRFTPQVSGLASVIVTEASSGENLGSSPYLVPVDPGRVDANATVTWGGGLEEGVVGSESAISVQTRDKFGNNRTDDSDVVWVEWRSEIDPDQGSWYRYLASPLGEGVYDGTLVPDLVPHLGRMQVAVEVAVPGALEGLAFPGGMWDPAHASGSPVSSKESSLRWEWEHPVPRTFRGFLIARVEGPEGPLGLLLRAKGGGVRLWVRNSLVFDSLSSEDDDEVGAETHRIILPQRASSGELLPFRMEFGNSPKFGHPVASLSLEWLEGESLLEMFKGPFTSVPILSSELLSVEPVLKGIPPQGAQVVPLAGHGPTSSISVESPLDGIRVGFPSSIPITVRDVYGNLAWDCQDLVLVRGWVLDDHLAGDQLGAVLEQVAPPGAVAVNGSMPSATCLDGAFHRISFVPTRSGELVLFASVNTILPDPSLGRGLLLDELERTLVSGTPIRVHVPPGITKPSASTALGEGLHFATAGVEASFVVQVRDIHGNQQTNLDTGDEFWVVFIPLSDTLRDLRPSSVMERKFVGQLVKQVDGFVEFHFTYVLEASAVYSVHIYGTAGELGNSATEELASSPYELIVSPHILDPQQSRVVHKEIGNPFGLGIADSFWLPEQWLLSSNVDYNSSVATIRIEARDKFGNLLQSGGEAMAVTVSGAQPSNISAVSALATSHVLGIVDHSNGTYDLYILHADPLIGAMPGGRSGAVQVAIELPSSSSLSQQPLTSQHDEFHGLRGRYFATREAFTRGYPPVVSRRDDVVRFNSLHEEVYESISKDAPAVGVWDGYIRSEHNSPLTVSLMHSPHVETAEIRLGARTVLYQPALDGLSTATSITLDSPVAGALYPIQLVVVSVAPTAVSLQQGTLRGAGEGLRAVNGTGAIQAHSSVLSTKQLTSPLHVHNRIQLGSNSSAPFEKEYEVIHVDHVLDLAYLDGSYEGPTLENAYVWQRDTWSLVPSDLLFQDAELMTPIQGSPVHFDQD